MLQKREEHFRALSISRWIGHHFSSGDYVAREAMQGVAWSILNKSRPRSESDCVKVWEDILNNLSTLVWPADPLMVTEEEWLSRDAEWWFHHFYDSEEWDIADVFEQNAFPIQPNFESWKQLVERNEHAEARWFASIQESGVAAQQWRCAAG